MSRYATLKAAVKRVADGAQGAGKGNGGRGGFGALMSAYFAAYMQERAARIPAGDDEQTCEQAMAHGFVLEYDDEFASRLPRS